MNNFPATPWSFKPEQWETDGDMSSAVCGADIRDAAGKSVFTLDLDDYSSLNTVTAQRIVACVNACEGLETPLLESSRGTMFHSLRMIERLGNERDLLLAAVEKILADPDGCPMCRAGKLINGSKEHWDRCGYVAAHKAMSACEGNTP